MIQPDSHLPQVGFLPAAGMYPRNSALEGKNCSAAVVSMESTARLNRDSPTSSQMPRYSESNVLALVASTGQFAISRCICFKYSAESFGFAIAVCPSEKFWFCVVPLLMEPSREHRDKLLFLAR